MKIDSGRPKENVGRAKDNILGFLSKAKPRTRINWEIAPAKIRFEMLINFSKLFTGINAVVWGYGLSSMIYFYSLAKLKNLFPVSYLQQFKSCVHRKTKAEAFGEHLESLLEHLLSLSSWHFGPTTLSI